MKNSRLSKDQVYHRPIDVRHSAVPRIVIRKPLLLKFPVGLLFSWSNFRLRFVVRLPWNFVITLAMPEEVPHFVPPEIQNNPSGWGPCEMPDQFKDMPYQPFSKGDRIGKVRIQYPQTVKFVLFP